MTALPQLLTTIGDAIEQRFGVRVDTPARARAETEKRARLADPMPTFRELATLSDQDRLRWYLSYRENPMLIDLINEQNWEQFYKDRNAGEEPPPLGDVYLLFPDVKEQGDH